MKMKSFLMIIICLCLFTVVGNAQGNKQSTSKAKTSQSKSDKSPQYVKPKGNRQFPLSDAVRVGDMLYLSGQLGTDENSQVVAGGIKAETKQIMEKIQRLLEDNGSSLDHVVKCTVMLADISEWGMMNEVYITYFKPEHLPARSAFGVNGLVRGARVEVECMAVVK